MGFTVENVSIAKGDGEKRDVQNSPETCSQKGSSTNEFADMILFEETKRFSDQDGTR